MKLARHYFQIGVIFCPKTINNITVKKSPWNCGRDRSSAFVHLNFGMYTHMHGCRRGKRTHD